MIRVFSKKKILIFCAIFLAAFLVWGSLLYVSLVPEAQSLGGIPGALPFGGLVGFVQPCTCSCGAVVVVGPPVGGSFLYCPGITQVFAYYQIPRPAVWLLGLYTPGGACLIWAGKLCVPAPIQPMGTIIMTGTSL